MSTATVASPAITTTSASPTEAHYTICPVFTGSLIADELGWIEEEFKRVGAKLSYLRSLPDDKGWLPHFSHEFAGHLFRDGGNIPSIWAKADRFDTTLVGLTFSHGAGQILVRADSGIRRVADLKGKKFGLYTSDNPDKVDFSRGTAERAIELALSLAGLSRADVQITDIVYRDNKSGGKSNKPSGIWANRRRNEELVLTEEAVALRDGQVDAIYAHSGRGLALVRTGLFTAIEDLSKRPDWTLKVANAPWAITVDTRLAKEHPEVVVAWLRAAIRAGRWANANRDAAAELFHRVSSYPSVEDTRAAIEAFDFVPNLSAQNLAGIEIEKQFLLSHGYIKKDFDVKNWADTSFLEEALKSL